MANKKIAANTLIISTRSFLVLVLSVFSSRWVFQGLGEVDFGLWSLVGVLILFVTALNNLMGASVARFIAYADGAGDTVGSSQWFSVAIVIHFIAAAFLTILGWSAGPVFIESTLNIPADRLVACVYVFRISLVATFFSMLSVPYVALLTAQQRIGEVSIWSLLQTVVIFFVATTLSLVETDRLVYYAKYVSILTALVSIGQIIRTRYLFPNFRLNLDDAFDKRKIKEIFSFSCWNVIGWGGVLFRDQGVAIIINVYVGPVANAAYAVAMQVANQVNQFASSLANAIAPEINAAAGRRDDAKVINLAGLANKWAGLLAVTLALPLCLNIDGILSLWLVNPPDDASILCKYILFVYIIDKVSSGYMLAVNANGRIAGYQMTLGLCQVLTLPLCWLALDLNLELWSIGVCFLSTITAVSIGRVAWAKYYFGITYNSWLKDVCLPVVIIMSLVSLSYFLIRMITQRDTFGLIVSLAVTVTVLAASVFIFGVTRELKKELSNKIAKYRWRN